MATPDEVRISRDGDFAIIAYADESIETTQYRIGAERLLRMTDDDILMVWNAGLATTPDDAARSRRDMSTLISEEGALAGVVVSPPNAPNQPFLDVGGRLYTAMEIAQLLGQHVGWTVKIELQRPPSKTED